MDYTWKIIKLVSQDEVNNDGVTLEDSVTRVVWQKIATDTDGTVASYKGVTDFTSKSTAQADFVALSSLNKETVVGWIQNALSTSDSNAINKILQTKVEKNRAQTSEMSPAWG